MKHNFVAKHMNKFNKSSYYKDVKHEEQFKLKSEDKIDIEKGLDKEVMDEKNRKS